MKTERRLVGWFLIIVEYFYSWKKSRQNFLEIITSDLAMYIEEKIGHGNSAGYQKCSTSSVENVERPNGEEKIFLNLSVTWSLFILFLIIVKPSACAPTPTLLYDLYFIIRHPTVWLFVCRKDSVFEKVPHPPRTYLWCNIFRFPYALR